MGIYSVTNVVTESTVLESEDLLSTDLDTYEESTEDFTVGATYGIMVENEVAMNEIMKAIGIAEFNYFENNGEEIMYEAANVEGFIEKIKAIFINIGKRVAALFKKFKNYLAQWAAKDADFIKQYGKAIDELGATITVEFEGYNFDDGKLADTGWIKADGGKMEDVNEYGSFDTVKKKIDAIGDDKDAAFEEIKKANEAFDDVTSLREKINGIAAGVASCGDEDMRKNIKDAFFGTENKVKITSVNVKAYKSYIEKSKDLQKQVDKAFKEYQDLVNEEIKKLNKLKSDMKSKVKSEKEKKYEMAMNLTRKASALSQYRLSVLNTKMSYQLNAIKDRNHQARKVLGKAVREGMSVKKEEPTDKNESAELTGAFAGVQIV